MNDEDDGRLYTAAGTGDARPSSRAQASKLVLIGPTAPESTIARLTRISQTRSPISAFNSAIFRSHPSF